jgi:hypothetical protein
MARANGRWKSTIIMVEIHHHYYVADKPGAV